MAKEEQKNKIAAPDKEPGVLEPKTELGTKRTEDNLAVATKKEAKNAKNKPLWRRILAGFVTALEWLFLAAFATAGTLFILAVVAVFAIYSSYAKDFAAAKIKNNSTQNTFYDKDKQIIYESYGTKSPDPTTLSELPPQVAQATLAAEDANFYQHGAIDPKGLVRAALTNLKNSNKSGLSKLSDLFNESDYTQGGSTITQQLVKNMYLTNEKSFDRKAKEIVYSFELEKKESKDQILTDYLNNVFYGEQSLGIKNAALAYYGKPVNQLDLAEISMLAGIPQAPTTLDPVSGDFNAAKTRQEYVLTQMYNLHEITLDQAKSAANEPLYFNQSPTGSDLVLKHPFFVDLVKKELADALGQDVVDRGGLSVYTTLDPKNQTVAENQAAIYMQKFAYRKVSNTAIVVLDNKKGTVSALVGGVNWDVSKINMALSPRQPGSSFKPIMYTTAFLNGFTAATRLVDKIVNFGGTPPYIPHNYSNSYFGNITAHYALDNSLNVPAVEMTKLVGVDKIIAFAKKLGISSIGGDSSTYGLSLGLGSAEISPWEMTRAFSTFANGGQMMNFSGLSSVTDASGNEIYRHQTLPTTIYDPRVAYIMANILSDTKARSLVFGTVNPLSLPDRRVGAKTGTTDDYADSWTIGFTPQYTVGVWMGNNDRSQMTHVSGIEGAAYIWQDVMKGIHIGLPAEDFTKPDGLETAWVNPMTGLPATYQGSPNILEYFLPGTEPGKTPDFSYLKQF